MYENFGKALCIKDRSFETDEDRGIVKILFTEDKNGGYSPYIPNSPAEDGIFIIHDYETGTNPFEENEIFCINSFRQSDKDDWKDGTGFKKRFVSDGLEISALSKFEMVPILNSSLPDKKSGILEGSVIPPTNKTFFIREGDTVYGPFLASRSGSDTYTLVPVNVPSLNLELDHILAVEYSTISSLLITNSASQNIYLPNINNIREINGSSPKIDYISDKDLIRYFAKHGFGRNIKKLSKSAARTLLDAADKYAQQKNSYKSSERLDRLKKIMEDYLSQDDIGQDIINEWANSKQGIKFLDKYVQDNRSTILHERISKLEEEAKQELADIEAKRKKYQDDHNAEKSRIDVELDKLRSTERQERQRIKNDLEDYLQQTEKQKEEALQEQAAELMASIDALKNEKTEIIFEKDSLESELDQFRRGRELKQWVDLLEMQKDELSRTVDERNALLKNPNELRKLAIQDKTLKQLLSLNLKPDSDQKIEFASVRCNNDPATSPKDYIDAIESYLDEQDGRTLTRDEVANLLICMTQNYLTCLAGLPGGGKTSTIVRLAEAIGLHNPADNKLCHFLNISVGQGWAGMRDLLGYYNAIKGEFQPAPTKLYEFLQSLDSDPEKKFFRLVLLDEGNLSPMEHYWSDFLQMADPEYRGKALSLGSKDSNLSLRPGNNLRWITTINSDETTERLSPRLLDRVPVIKMDPVLDIESTLDFSSVDSQEIPGGVTWSLMEKWFKPEEDKDFSALDRQVIKSILDQNNKSNMLHVSQRKLKNMRQYLNSANIYMDSSQALDWCIAMYVLPTIEGYGKRVEDGLTALCSEFEKNELKRSLGIAETILEQGRMSQSFSFF